MCLVAWIVFKAVLWVHVIWCHAVSDGYEGSTPVAWPLHALYMCPTAWPFVHEPHQSVFSRADTQAAYAPSCHNAALFYVCSKVKQRMSSRTACTTARLRVVSESTCTASCSFVPYSCRSWAQASHWLKALRSVMLLKKDRATRAALFSSTDSCHCLQHCSVHAQMQHIRDKQHSLFEVDRSVQQPQREELKSVRQWCNSSFGVNIQDLVCTLITLHTQISLHCIALTHTLCIRMLWSLFASGCLSSC